MDRNKVCTGLKGEGRAPWVQVSLRSLGLAHALPCRLCSDVPLAQRGGVRAHLRPVYTHARTERLKPKERRLLRLSG